jgi:hypothetical protein
MLTHHERIGRRALAASHGGNDDVTIAPDVAALLTAVVDLGSGE